MWTSSSLNNVNHSGWHERIVLLIMSIIQADVKVKFTLQCQWSRLIWTSSSLCNISDSGRCKRLVHFKISVIHADVNVQFTLPCESFRRAIFQSFNSENRWIKITYHITCNCFRYYLYVFCSSIIFSRISEFLLICILCRHRQHIPVLCYLLSRSVFNRSLLQWGKY